MSPAAKRPAPDQAERDGAINERRLNVLIDAGAGTGKTSTLVARIIALVAPKDDSATPMRLDRVAAVTFTRRAAGELRLRLRERLLAELAAPVLSEPRSARLRSALGLLDTGYIGTIHSFADRLLRLQPVEADLSPSYDIAEDDDALVRETFERLISAAETGTLAAELSGSAVLSRASEAEQTVLDALRAGVRAESEELDFTTRYGLDSMVAELIGQRDVPPRDPTLQPFNEAAFRATMTDLRAALRPVDGPSSGARWLQRLAALLQRLAGERDPIVLYAELRRTLYSLRSPTLKDDFESDAVAWHAWKLLIEGNSKKVQLGAPLRDDLLAPLRRWLATRLVRLFPVVIHLYERVKASHQAVDSVDLLLKLRDLLARDKPTRARYQALFDHVFVDEFQDTDPLQAEVLLFLCENGALAGRAMDVELADGKLTLVGDPKQSIYRFRRADIAMYESVRAKVASRRYRAVRLSANFRSTPPLIEWFNDRFEAVLGPAAKSGESSFSPATGEVSYQPLRRGRSDGQNVAIHVVPFDPGPDAKAADYRALEAETLARYLRWLVERSDIEVLDPVTFRRRRVTFADIAVLAFETSNLSLLFPQLDAMGIPHAARGGTLFLQDPIHRQFILGLRAIADETDGVAQAALHRPPFFSIDVSDLLLDTPEAARVRAVIADLRARRLTRAPGATARDLLELTGFGRTIALGPNGAQRLDRVRELCLVVEQTAATQALDYDAVTQRTRKWAVAPAKLDPPHPVGEDAVQIMTVHQAKGLEFPVVVLWDGRAGIGAHAERPPWHVAREGTAWQLALDGLEWEEPAGAALLETERRYRDAERKRLVYVAATRARDLLVVPKAGVPGMKHVAGVLLAGGHGPMALELQTYTPDKTPPWARDLAPKANRPAGVDESTELRVAAAWSAAVREASAPVLAPIGAARAAHQEGEIRAHDTRPGRFGSVFGETVHRAIGDVLLKRFASPAEAVARAAHSTGLDEHLAEAEADTQRALAALETAGLLGAPATIRLEYPIVGRAGGNMLVGYIDLLAVLDGRVIVVDFKTDRRGLVPGPRDAFPEYARQLDTYATLLVEAGLADAAKTALLFTETGALEWLS